MGSLGHQVADVVAERLGYRVVWREVINLAAQRARTPEVALATIDELDLLGLRPALKAVRAYQQAVDALMHELAADGDVVIVGRAGQVILRAMPDVLHVRLYAPQALRIQRIAEKNGISAEAARAQVVGSDTSRMRYLRRYYHADWCDSDLYDLMINTAQFSVQEAAEIVCQAAQERAKKK